MLNYKYEKIIEAPVFKPNLNIHPVSVEVKGDSAICKMGGYESYQIHLVKNDKLWIVIGENNQYPTAERITKVKNSISKYQKYIIDKPELLKVQNVAYSALHATYSYFKTKNLDSLSINYDKVSVDFIRRLYKFVQKRIGLEILFNEMDKPKSIAFDIDISNEKVICKHYGSDINILLIKIDKTYKVVGFNGIDSGDITNEIIEKEYKNLLNSLGLIRDKRYRGKVFK